MNTRHLQLRDRAILHSAEILADSESKRSQPDLLAVAFLRGYSEALADVGAYAAHTVEETDRTARDQARRAGFELECA